MTGKIIHFRFNCDFCLARSQEVKLSSSFFDQFSQFL